MTPTDFALWVARMKETRGWTSRECAKRLGCGVNQIKIWQDKAPPRYIGLACNALAKGISPWGGH